MKRSESHPADPRGSREGAQHPKAGPVRIQLLQDAQGQERAGLIMQPQQRSPQLLHVHDPHVRDAEPVADLIQGCPAARAAHEHEGFFVSNLSIERRRLKPLAKRAQLLAAHRLAGLEPQAGESEVLPIEIVLRRRPKILAEPLLAKRAAGGVAAPGHPGRGRQPVNLQIRRALDESQNGFQLSVPLETKQVSRSDRLQLMPLEGGGCRPQDQTRRVHQHDLGPLDDRRPDQGLCSQDMREEMPGG